MCLACIIPGKRMAMAIYLFYISEKDNEDHQAKGEEIKNLISRAVRIWFGYG